MTKRMIPLIAIVVFMMAAPAAMAECYRCKIRPFPHTEPPSCVVAQVGGWTTCEPDFENDTCILGPRCGTGLAEEAVAPLASEFTVASVERIGNAQPAANPALVAALDLSTPTR